MGVGRKDYPSVCLVAAVFLMCCMVPLADCRRLRKAQRPVAKREDVHSPTAVVQEGKIVLGKVFESSDIDRKSSFNESLDDESDYQADFAGWSQEMDVDEASKELWEHLGAYLHCFDDHMKFRSLGTEASQLSVVQANEPPIPLSTVPPRCGYRIYGTSITFILIVPFKGCNIIQQGGNHILPLLWQGHPLSLLCPEHTGPVVPPVVPPVGPVGPVVPPMGPVGPVVPPVGPVVPPVGPVVPPVGPFDFYYLQAADDLFQRFPFYPFPYPPPTAPPPTEEPKVLYPQIPFNPELLWPYWPQLPEFPPIFPCPQGKCPVPGQTAPCIIQDPATTQTPHDTPAKWYPIVCLPLLPDEQHFQDMFYQG
ncbi:pistil-specific extensin-like protein isoform X3 [Xiphophorus couchianus]|uniref:pistil-specific extensin-like protein isoform X3 n=1 Tax=Xiphophorus couchianus TaxID=32473 RepID=UPI001016C5E5|nr:pistil-specific extensin-like protein isoform X3 [Xiphophorus couchianus]